MNIRSGDKARRLFDFRKIFVFHTLSGKITLFSGLVVTASAIIVIVVAGVQFVIPAIILVLFSTLGTYFGAKYHLGNRIELARDTLRRTRKYKFRNLDAADIPKGDELNELIRQIYRTGVVLEREIRQLKRVENYRRVFIGNVSHELKTPVFAIQGFAETLLGGAIDDDEVNRKFVERIIKNSERLNNLTADLIDISRIETGELEMSFSPFSLPKTVAEVLESLEDKAEKNQIAMVNEVPDDLPLLEGDEPRIRQVLINLIDNALKYSDSGGKMTISADRTQSKNVRIRVSDTGIGIPKKSIHRLTERFYRVDKSRSRSAGGTGLGLAIVKHILAAHKQRLKISSEEGKGSSFQFSLPLADVK